MNTECIACNRSHSNRFLNSNIDHLFWRDAIPIKYRCIRCSAYGRVTKALTGNYTSVHRKVPMPPSNLYETEGCSSCLITCLSPLPIDEVY